MREEGLVKSVAFVRRATEGRLDHRVDREEGNAGAVGSAADLVVADDALGREDDPVAAIAMSMSMNWSPSSWALP